MTVPFLVASAALIGLMIGSFLNVCIARIPAGESVVSPASRCPHCRTPIRWHDNIPVLGYLVLGGKCRACRAPISWRYPAVELATAAAFAVVAWTFADTPALLAARAIFAALLIVLFGTDYDVKRLPDVVTYPGMAVGLGFALIAPPGIRDAALGAALGAAILWGVRWVWLRLTGVDGMGLGDVKMLAMIGAFLGWQQVWVTLFLASVTGAVIGVVLTTVGGRSMQSKLPFGCFLSVAAFIAALENGRLMTWYMSLYR